MSFGVIRRRIRARFFNPREIRMQAADPHPQLATFFVIWAAVGPLAGILIGHYLTRSWQREQWLLDNTRQEYKELLSVLIRSYNTIIALQAPGLPRGPEEERALQSAYQDVLAVTNDRLFIAAKPALKAVVQAWNFAAMEFSRDGDGSAFRGSFERIQTKILRAARQDLGFSQKGDKLVE
jgi:hypothetical protein